MLALYHRYAIRWQLIANPGSLFHRINHLNWYKDALLDWAQTLPVKHGVHLLEVGCATGVLSRQLAKKASVTGLDRSATMIEHARRYNRGQNIHFGIGDIMALPFADRQFDSTLAASLINIVSDPQQALQEMQRVTVSGGCVSVLVPDATMSTQMVYELVTAFGLTGFSREALLTWHRLAPKVSVDELCAWFETAELGGLDIRQHLQGMIVSVTGHTL